MPTEALALLLRQISDGLRSTMPADEVLAAMQASSTAVAPCAALFADLQSATARGQSLVEPLARHPALFAPETLALLDSAERGGALGLALSFVADELEGQLQWRRMLLGALAWPLFVGIWLVALAIVAMVLVVPSFREVFKGFGADLPLPTLLLFGVAQLFASLWPVLLLLLLGLAIGLPWWWRRRGRHTLVALLGQASLLRLPLVGPFLNAVFALRLARVLLAVAEGRLPAAMALAYLRASAGNAELARRAALAEAALTAGQPLHQAVRDAQLGGGDLAYALTVDSRSAVPGQLLRTGLQQLEDSVQRRRMQMQQGFIALAYIATGLGVGLFVTGLYLPIFKLGSVI